MSASSSRLVVGLLFLIGTAACSYLTPYKIDIQQGNVVTPEAIDKLSVGMTKSQVGFILGTPLLADVFHGNRWDYVYYLRKGGRIREERKVRLLFEDSKLKQIDGDVVAAKAKAAKAQGADSSAAAKAPGTEPSAAAKEKDAEPSEVVKAQDSAPGEAAKPVTVAPSEAASAKDAAPGDAAKAKDAEPVEPAPARNEKKQP